MTRSSKGSRWSQNIVEPRQTLPILANVLLETEEGSMRLTATDLEVGARVSIPARVMGKGAITVVGAQAGRDRQGASRRRGGA